MTPEDVEKEVTRAVRNAYRQGWADALNKLSEHATKLREDLERLGKPETRT